VDLKRVAELGEKWGIESPVQRLTEVLCAIWAAAGTRRFPTTSDAKSRRWIEMPAGGARSGASAGGPASWLVLANSRSPRRHRL